MKTGTNPLITLVLLKCVYDLMRKGFATLSPDVHGSTTSLFHACDARGIVAIFLRCPSDAAPAQSLAIERQPSKFRKLGNAFAYIPSRSPLTQPASMITFAILLHYEYSPFGETVVSTGPNASDFLHRFSTKPAEDNTGLVLYEYRPYSPSLGRWLPRDPLGDEAFFLQYSKSLAKKERNQLSVERTRPLYVFIGNRPIDAIDKLGLALCLFNPARAGSVDFTGCSATQLDDFRLIPESGTTLTTPSNGRHGRIDGFWRRGSTQWFKIPNHCYATITCTATGFSWDSCCNVCLAAIQRARGRPYECGYVPDSPPTEHATNDPF